MVTGGDIKGHEVTPSDTSGHLFCRKLFDRILERKMREAYTMRGWSCSSVCRRRSRRSCPMKTPVLTAGQARVG